MTSSEQQSFIILCYICRCIANVCDLKVNRVNSHNAEFEYQLKVVSEQHTLELARKSIIRATQNWNIKVNFACVVLVS